MIAGKLWRSFRAQANKLANYLWAADPIAQMQYEYDLAVDQLRDGRKGLEQYRALVERVDRRVAADEQQLAHLAAKVTAYLGVGNRELAARTALELQKVRQQLAENQEQLDLHETAYEHNVAKVKSAGQKLAQMREKIVHYDAQLKMSRAEAELANLASDFQLKVTTDFGRLEQMVNDAIGLNRAKVRVAADLSGQAPVDLDHEQALEAALAERALAEFETLRALSSPTAASQQHPQPQLSAPPPKAIGNR